MGTINDKSDFRNNILGLTPYGDRTLNQSEESAKNLSYRVKYAVPADITKLTTASIKSFGHVIEIKPISSDDFWELIDTEKAEIGIYLVEGLGSPVSPEPAGDYAWVYFDGTDIIYLEAMGGSEIQE